MVRRAARFIPRVPFETAVDTDELLRAVIEFLRVWREQAPSRVPTSWGTIYRDERFHAIHQANLGWVASLPKEGLSKILADLAEAFRGTAVRHQALLFEDAAEAYSVQEELAGQGFRPVSELAMAQGGPAACIGNPEDEIRPAGGRRARGANGLCWPQTCATRRRRCTRPSDSNPSARCGASSANESIEANPSYEASRLRFVDLGLRGKVALVAAASQGLGRAAAFAFARESCKVAICARTAGSLEDAAKAMRRETSADVAAIPADVSRADGVKAFVDGAVASFGGVDVVVPNAGGPPPGGFETLADDQWAKGWELTFQSTVRLIRACLPSMRARGGGAVVAILSMSVRQPIDNLVLSNSLRLGVVGALKTLAREVARDRIRVNGVAPGWIATDRTIQLHRARAEKERRRIEDVQAAVLQEIPMGRMGTAEEVADLITFLASDRAAYITGVIAQIDGGLYRGIF